MTLIIIGAILFIIGIIIEICITIREATTKESYTSVNQKLHNYLIKQEREVEELKKEFYNTLDELK